VGSHFSAHLHRRTGPEDSPTFKITPLSVQFFVNINGANHHSYILKEYDLTSSPNRCTV
jgi:hypothetical protein